MEQRFNKGEDIKFVFENRICYGKIKEVLHHVDEDGKMRIHYGITTNRSLLNQFAPLAQVPQNDIYPLNVQDSVLEFKIRHRA